MKTIYIDDEYKCFLSDAESRQRIETDVFDNVPDLAIPCYRLIPNGNAWTAPSGERINGLAIMAIDKESSEMAYKIQRQFNEDNDVMNSVLTQIETALGITEVENDYTGTITENP